jgi:RluA family pseudouridine synthase
MANRKSFSSVEDGVKLLSFLQKRLPLSGKAIKRIIDAGGVRVNGVIERFSSHLLRKGEKVTIDLQMGAFPTKFSFPILYEDDFILIGDKPSGLVSSNQSFTPFFTQKIYLVHRLDKGTSGVIILAKDLKTQKKMEDLFRKRKVEKVYLALVEGRVRRSEGMLESYLDHKKAVTHWKCLKKGRDLSLLQLIPKTGRTHQLRIHLSKMGHPILGDIEYGRRVSKTAYRLLLHASCITFTHPVTGKKIRVTSPLKIVDMAHMIQPSRKEEEEKGRDQRGENENIEKCGKRDLFK